MFDEESHADCFTSVEKHRIGGIEPSQVDEEVQQAQSIMSKLASLLIEGQGPWLHGHSATALDAHVIMFLARLQDAGRANLMPIRRYLAMVMETWEWQDLMAGNRTIRDVR
jgi:glutathione S-transferase